MYIYIYIRINMYTCYGNRKFESSNNIQGHAWTRGCKSKCEPLRFLSLSLCVCVWTFIPPENQTWQCKIDNSKAFSNIVSFKPPFKGDFPASHVWWRIKDQFVLQLPMYHRLMGVLGCDVRIYIYNPHCHFLDRMVPLDPPITIPFYENASWEMGLAKPFCRK